jgi:hypothetical protein
MVGDDIVKQDESAFSHQMSVQQKVTCHACVAVVAVNEQDIQLAAIEQARNALQRVLGV